MYAIWYVPSIILIGIALRVGSAMPNVRNNCLKGAVGLAILATAPLLYSVIDKPAAVSEVPAINAQAPQAPVEPPVVGNEQ